MTLMHGQPVPIGVPEGGPVCEDCEKLITRSVICMKCSKNRVQDAVEDAKEEMAESQATTAKRARDWIGRRRLMFPSEVTREVEAAFELFIRDAEDGQC